MFLNPFNKDKRIFKPIWVFGGLVLSLNTYTGVHMVCYFITIHMPYDELYIMLVLYENKKRSTV